MKKSFVGYENFFAKCIAKLIPKLILDNFFYCFINIVFWSLLKNLKSTEKYHNIYETVISVQLIPDIFLHFCIGL